MPRVQKWMRLCKLSCNELGRFRVSEYWSVYGEEVVAVVIDKAHGKRHQNVKDHCDLCVAEIVMNKSAGEEADSTAESTDKDPAAAPI